MFTVIVPTMWKGEELAMALPLIDSCEAVGEIIIINNLANATPLWFTSFPWHKVRTYTPPSNIFVNPAFNVGVSLSKFDQIALLQDDVLFNPIIFNHVTPVLTNNVGVLGCDGKCIIVYPERSQLTAVPPRNIQVEPVPMPLLPGYAVLMMLHKDNWHPIDETLKIHLGEEWIVQWHLKLGKTPLIMRNFFLTALGAMKTSGLPEFKSNLENEGKAHAYINNKIWQTQSRAQVE